MIIQNSYLFFPLVPESDSLSTRAASAFRTKGGVAIGFSIFGTSLLFLNCHLTAHAEKFKERERDLKKIFHSLDLPKELPVRKKHRGRYLAMIFGIEFFPRFFDNCFFIIFFSFPRFWFFIPEIFSKYAKKLFYLFEICDNFFRWFLSRLVLFCFLNHRYNCWTQM